jgi:hypothetical protein
MAAALMMLHQWQYGAFALLALVLFVAGRLVTGREWIDSLGTIGGASVYCASLYVLLALPVRPEGTGIADFLAGGLLVFLSFLTWVCSLVLEPAGAWVSRVVAAVTLAAAMLLLGGPAGDFR